MRTKNNNSIKTNLPFWKALTPIIVLITLLFFNVVYVFGDDALSGSNQFILLFAAAIAIFIGFTEKIPFKNMVDSIKQQLSSISEALLILLMVGALTGTWLSSGVIPTMVYYGLEVLNAEIFLVASVLISIIVSVSTGSSWTTSATVGIALIGIAKTLNIPVGMTAGAILSGAYFGDKLSPLSDTTNLAASIAGTNLYTHIKYMLWTTIPSIVITILFFIVLGFTLETSSAETQNTFSSDIKSAFNISGWLLLVPLSVFILVIKKIPPLISLFIGAFTGGIATCIAQPQILLEISGSLTNVSASDQYLAIVVPGKMLNEAYKKQGLAPENLSRTLEDSGTVTSVLIPWNTCGAYHAKTLGVDVSQFIFFAVFNWLSPLMTLIFAIFKIKIKQLHNS